MLTVTCSPFTSQGPTQAPLTGSGPAEPVTLHPSAPRRALHSRASLSWQILVLIPSHTCNQLDPTTSAPFSISQWLGQSRRQRETCSQILALSLFYLQQPLDKIQRKHGVRPRASRSHSSSHAGHCSVPRARERCTPGTPSLRQKLNGCFQGHSFKLSL